MELNLLSCEAQRPDTRAITNCIVEIAGIEKSQAHKLTNILLEGDPIEIEIPDSNVASALRALRKLEIDYEIIE